MFAACLKGMGNNAVSVDLVGRTSVCNGLFKADGWQRGEGVLFNPWFRASIFPLSCSNLAGFSGA